MPAADADNARFTLFAFLRDKALAILVALLVIALDALVLAIISVTTDAILLVCGVQITAVVVILAVEYARRVRFYKELETIVSSIDRVDYFADLIREPSFSEGSIAYQAACGISSLASAEITDLKSRNAENAEYTELWVHEMKTPLAAMKLVVSKMHGSDAKKLKYELERIELLVNQALFAARSETLSNDYTIREVVLADLVSESCKENMQYLTSLGVSLNMLVDPELEVYADKSWLIFILSQLITNAAKYDARSITFTATAPNHEGPSAQTVLEIRDDGCGIPAADVPRVFDRGFTGEVGRAHGSATGMGLYLAARLCARMGLSITLFSEEGVGTRVQIGFPHDRRRRNLIDGEA